MPRRGVRTVILGAAAAAALALPLTGCSTVLTGMPAASPSGPAPGSQDGAAPENGPGAVEPPVDTTDLHALLVGPGDFPAGYTAQVLEHRNALLASADLGGVSADSRVSPVRCQPSATLPGEQDLAMASGMRDDGKMTLAVILSRTDEPIGAAEDLMGRCLDVVSDQFGVQSRITRKMVDRPGAGTAGEFAYAQTVSSGSGEIAQTRESVTLVAQIDDVRISVIGMSQQGAEVDRAALEQLLAESVANFR